MLSFAEHAAVRHEPLILTVPCDDMCFSGCLRFFLRAKVQLRKKMVKRVSVLPSPWQRLPPPRPAQLPEGPLRHRLRLSPLPLLRMLLFQRLELRGGLSG